MWVEAYATEAAVISHTLRDIDHRVEHVGSTAVAGMPAKPIIDIMVGVSDYERFEEMRLGLRTIGYAWDPRAEHDDPRRRVFRRGPSEMLLLRSHHLHLTIGGGDYWRRIIAFRDQLRRDPTAAAEYAAVKRRLLRERQGDPRDYTAGKHEIVKRIERDAGVDVP